MKNAFVLTMLVPWVLTQVQPVQIFKAARLQLLSLGLQIEKDKTDKMICLKEKTASENYS